MGESDLGTAVELPVRRVVPTTSLRRHRPLTGLSGILLFACMFLPAVKGCSQPVMPLEMPPFLPPYLYGLVFAFVVLARTPRGIAHGVLALRVLAMLVVAGSLVLMLIVPPVGVVELLVGMVLLATIGMSGSSEHRLAASGITVGMVCTVWFGMWTATPDAMIGVYASLATSLGLLVGSLIWLCELVVRPPDHVPRAMIHSRK